MRDRDQRGPPTRSFTDHLKERGEIVWIWVKGFILAAIFATIGIVVSVVVFESGIVFMLSILFGGMFGRVYVDYRYFPKVTS